MGGYVAGPGGVAAWLCRRPLLIHEQNAIAGTTNRLLAPFASRVMAGFPGAFAHRQYVVSGNPVRADLLQNGAATPYTLRTGQPLRLLVLGGSLGAQPINEVMPPVVRAINSQSDGPALEVWHQSGEAHIASLKESYGELLQGTVQVAPFIDDMASAYGWADLVLCRAGALTVSELAIMGRPAILVPLPHAIDDHQTANARALSEVGAAILLPQRDMGEGGLCRLIGELLAEPARLTQMADAARASACPDATDRVCDACEDMIHGR